MIITITIRITIVSVICVGFAGLCLFEICKIAVFFSASFLYLSEPLWDSQHLTAHRAGQICNRRCHGTEIRGGNHRNCPLTGKMHRENDVTCGNLWNSTTMRRCLRILSRYGYGMIWLWINIYHILSLAFWAGWTSINSRYFDDFDGKKWKKPGFPMGFGWFWLIPYVGVMAFSGFPMFTRGAHRSRPRMPLMRPGSQWLEAIASLKSEAQRQKEMPSIIHSMCIYIYIYQYIFN